MDPQILTANPNHVQSNTMASAAFSDSTRALQGTNRGAGRPWKSYDPPDHYTSCAGSDGVEQCRGNCTAHQGAPHPYATKLSSVPKTNRDSSLNTTFCPSAFHIDLAWHHCRRKCPCSVSWKVSAWKVRLIYELLLQGVWKTGTIMSARTLNESLWGHKCLPHDPSSILLLVVFLVALDPFFRAYSSRVHCSPTISNSPLNEHQPGQQHDQPAVFIPMIRPLKHT
ncbi:uncharacterized protein TNCV_3320331 [Trichonephila clavipes]|nr:uncharacterized protein TNCV_3320331 [Trichonephila clavipes]